MSRLIETSHIYNYNYNYNYYYYLTRTSQQNNETRYNKSTKTLS